MSEKKAKDDMEETMTMVLKARRRLMLRGMLLALTTVVVSQLVANDISVAHALGVESFVAVK